MEVTSGVGKAVVQPAVSVLAPVFTDDPAITYMLNSLSWEERTAYLPSYFTKLLTAAVLNRAVIYQTGSWRCCSVIVPPGEDVGNPLTMLPAGGLGLLWTLGVSGCKKMIWEYTNATDRAKKAEMGKKAKYFYVFFIGTAVDGRGQGLASRLIEEAKVVAERDGLPVWLEATTERSRRLYAKLGFTPLGDIVLGKGRVGKDGEVKNGGEGVTVWPMIWRPDATKATKA